MVSSDMLQEMPDCAGVCNDDNGRCDNDLAGAHSNRDLMGTLGESIVTQRVASRAAAPTERKKRAIDRKINIENYFTREEMQLYDIVDQ